jgi:hypothetical protein
MAGEISTPAGLCRAKAERCLEVHVEGFLTAGEWGWGLE